MQPPPPLIRNKYSRAAAETEKIVKISKPPPPELYFHRPVWNFLKFLHVFSQMLSIKVVFLEIKHFTGVGNYIGKRRRTSPFYLIEIHHNILGTFYQITFFLSDVIKTKLKNCLGSKFIIDLFVFPTIFSIYFAQI